MRQRSTESEPARCWGGWRRFLTSERAVDWKRGNRHRGLGGRSHKREAPETRRSPFAFPLRTDRAFSRGFSGTEARAGVG